MTAEAATTIGLPEPQGIGEDPLLHATKVYVLFLQGLFQQFPTGSYRWNYDEGKTEIAITDQSPFPRERIQQRPAIIAMRGPEQFGNLSLDNLRKLDFRTGMKERTDLVACTMSLCCVAKQGLEAQRIAWIVQSQLRQFKTLIQRGGGFHKIGDEVSMGPETPPGSVITPESDSEAVMCVVQSPFFFQWTAQGTPLNAPKLAAIMAHIQAGIDPSVGQTSEEQAAIFNQPTILGKPVSPLSSSVKI